MYYATKHTDFSCPHCQKTGQVYLDYDGSSGYTVACPNCLFDLWDGLDMDSSDVPHVGHSVGIFKTPAGLRAYFMPFNNLSGTIVPIDCEACFMVHAFNQSTLDSAYNSVRDDWSYQCLHKLQHPSVESNQSLNALMHLDRWIEKQIVIQKNPLNQRYATNPVNPANYANILIRDMVPPVEEPKSTQYGGLSREEWDQLKPWQQFKHLDKIKNPSHYYQEGKPFF